jgi:GxxExxY protein
MINQQYKYSDLTSKVIGCAMKVHSALGNGFQEVIYQRALGIEFNIAEIPFSREFEMAIYYHNKQIGTRSVDFLVANVLSVELKAITKLEDVHFAQAINYLGSAEERQNFDLQLVSLVKLNTSARFFR